jgi:hypothetical protein
MTCRVPDALPIQPSSFVLHALLHGLCIDTVRLFSARSGIAMGLPLVRNLRPVLRLRHAEPETLLLAIEQHAHVLQPAIPSTFACLERP